MSGEATMRISATIEQVDMSHMAMIEHAEIAAKAGVDGLWVSQLPNQRDSAMLLAGLAARVSDVAIGTAVFPIYLSPPAVMAQTALTLDEISGNRLVLGLGRGHRFFAEWMLGGRYPASVAPVREYLTIVTSLIRQGEVNAAGSWFSARAMYGAPRRAELPVYLGSFGPRMLELAGELADGVILWLCTPSYVRDVVMPSLRAGWARRPGGHDGFGVVVILPALVSPQPEQGRDCGRNMLNGYLRIENYQKLLTASGFGDDVRSLRVSEAMIDDLCAIGSAQTVRERIAAYRAAGVTEIALNSLEEKDFVATVEAGLA
ncbi:MAG TPA: LLM class flavin-dependent oxidoreductase [Streptosporangiaceae bacterium]|nr:LLM class flavin-dependent oxidoreductase [Streptosporangiaceae bacterium]